MNLIIVVYIWKKNHCEQFVNGNNKIVKGLFATKFFLPSIFGIAFLDFIWTWKKPPHVLLYKVNEALVITLTAVSTAFCDKKKM